MLRKREFGIITEKNVATLTDILRETHGTQEIGEVLVTMISLTNLTTKHMIDALYKESNRLEAVSEGRCGQPSKIEKYIARFQNGDDYMEIIKDAKEAGLSSTSIWRIRKGIAKIKE